MKKIKEINLKNKKVIIRVDYNVPLNDKLEIIDDNRIKESLETIKYCLDNNCKIILLSHLGKVKTEADFKTKSLKCVAERLSELLKKKIKFIPEAKGILVDEAINNMNDRDIILLENTRFLDIPNKLESGCDENLSKYWANLADVFINDAFGTIHRSHASNVGIAKYSKEKCVGFLVIKELTNLNKLITNPDKPFTVILGGAKISDKIGIIENLSKKANYILIGGAMAFTFLKAKGLPIGTSLVDEDSLDFAKTMLAKTNKIILPCDFVVTDNGNNANHQTTKIIPDDKMGLDIGPETLKLFQNYINKSKTIFWNGPMGYYENKTYQEGTKKLCEIISKTDALSVVGGGDSASCVINLGFKDKFSHVSTGGGASLELLEGKSIPGIEAMK